MSLVRWPGRTSTAEHCICDMDSILVPLSGSCICIMIWQVPDNGEYYKGLSSGMFQLVLTSSPDHSGFTSMPCDLGFLERSRRLYHHRPAVSCLKSSSLSRSHCSAYRDPVAMNVFKYSNTIPTLGQTTCYFTFICNRNR